MSYSLSHSYTGITLSEARLALEKTEAGAAHFVDGIIRTSQNSVIASRLELEEQCAHLRDNLDETTRSPTLAK